MSLPRSRYLPSRRDDPILGPVKVCTGCGEEWPTDTEFWYVQRLKPDKPSRLYAKCRACWSERNQVEPCDPPTCVRRVGHEGAHRPTLFAYSPCRAWMPKAQQECARRAGHVADHRTRGYLEDLRETTQRKRAS